MGYSKEGNFVNDRSMIRPDPRIATDWTILGQGGRSYFVQGVQSHELVEYSFLHIEDVGWCHLLYSEYLERGSEAMLTALRKWP